jgi:hypothetical protein
VVIVVKTGSDAGVRICQVGKDGPVAQFKQLGFEARLEALGLGTVVALAAAIRELGPGIAQQRFVDVAYVLPTPVRVDN